VIPLPKTSLKARQALRSDSPGENPSLRLGELAPEGARPGRSNVHSQENHRATTASAFCLVFIRHSGS